MGKRFLLASLLLGVGLLSPASALAGAGGSNLPLMGRSTGVVSYDDSTFQFTSSNSGVLSVLGAFTASLSGQLGPTNDPNEYSLAGTGTDVAANGDELFGTVNGTGANSTSTGTYVFTITGGTGRFADATGSYTVTFAIHLPNSIVGTIVSNPVTATFHGSINLGAG
jgi:hypothetical protein